MSFSIACSLRSKRREAALNIRLEHLQRSAQREPFRPENGCQPEVSRPSLALQTGMRNRPRSVSAIANLFLSHSDGGGPLSFNWSFNWLRHRGRLACRSMSIAVLTATSKMLTRHAKMLTRVTHRARGRTRGIFGGAQELASEEYHPGWPGAWRNLWSRVDQGGDRSCGAMPERMKAQGLFIGAGRTTTSSKC